MRGSTVYGLHSFKIWLLEHLYSVPSSIVNSQHYINIALYMYMCIKLQVATNVGIETQ